MTVTLLDDSVSERKRVIALSNWAVAPKGFTGRFCPSCGSFFTEDEMVSMCVVAGNRTGYIKCIHCGFDSSPTSAGIAVRSDNAHLLKAESVLSQIWYHATLMNDWHRKMLDRDIVPLVHLGTKAAALARAKDIDGYLSGDRTWQLYAIRIHADAVISPEIVEDHDNKAPVTEQKNKAFRDMGYQLNGVTRYVNRFEAEGSISLIANPRICSIVGQESHK